MSVNINKVIIAGNLTRDPQVKFLANERAVCNFGIAINRKFKDAGGAQKEEVTFIDVEAWGRTAELAGQYLTKGRPVFIEGRLKLDQYEDKDGKKQSRLRVVADNLQFLGAPGERKPAEVAAESDNAKAPQQPAEATNATPDEPPF